MKPKWILEKDVFQNGHSEIMYQRAIDQGLEAVMVGSVNYGLRELIIENPGKTPVHVGLDLFKDDDCVVAYGSINLVNMLHKFCPWTPTAWFNLEALSCRNYYALWGRYLLQREYMFIPFGALPLMRDFLYRSIGEADCLFMRPDDNKKSFSGMVVSKDKFDKWYNDESEFCEPDHKSMAVVAKPVSLDGEWRFIVSNGSVVSSSSYLIAGDWNDHTPTPNEAMALAVTVANDPWQPDDIYVVDICKTKFGEFKVVEIGSVNCAGFYGCDVGKVMDAMTEIAIRKWNEIFCP